MTYSTLLICQIKTIDPDTLSKILEFKRKGLNVVFIGQKPFLSTGLRDHEARDLKVKQLSDRIFESGANFIEDPNQQIINPHQGLSDWTKEMIEKCNIEKGITIRPNSTSLFYNQRMFQDTNLFFIVNSDRDQTIEINLNINIQDKKVWRWCPESLQREILSEDSGKDFSLNLSPLESALLVVDNESAIDPGKKNEISKNQEFELKGNWKVECMHHITHSEFSTELFDLMDLSELDSLKDFSGQISYTLHFDLEEKTYTYIDPGDVYDIAEIFINGTYIGTRWWGKLPLIIPENLLKDQGNTVIIKVHNRLFNYCSSLTDNPVAKRWIDMNRDKTKLPAGLLGPVRLS